MGLGIKIWIKKNILKRRVDVKPDLLSLYAFIAPSTINRGINLRLDYPVEGKTFLTVGEDCIVSGNFIFESTEGKITIGNHSYIGGGNFISRSAITIGDNVTIAWGGTVYDHNSHSLDYLERRKDIDTELHNLRQGKQLCDDKDWSVVTAKPIVIKDDVWIGMNVTILKGVTIGRGAVVGACSVVTKDVPDWTVVAGNPAKVVKRLGKDIEVNKWL